MAKIIKPNNFYYPASQDKNAKREISNVSTYLDFITHWEAEVKEPWEKKRGISKLGFHSSVWFRGVSKTGYDLEPGIYRKDFTQNLTDSSFKWKNGDEEKRLQMERAMLMDFRAAGATFFDAEDVVTLYFIAQHHGFPTRLLDWTTNPLAALFFAAEAANGENGDKEDGEVIVMQCLGLVLPTPDKVSGDYPRWIASMRHGYVTKMIKHSFWEPIPDGLERVIAPVRPDLQVGRITQQSSCFTLHAHDAGDKKVETLRRFRIPGGSKSAIMKELHSLNINQFTVYHDLDRLAREIKNRWGVVWKK